MSKEIIAIDPGTEKTAWVVMESETKRIVDYGITPNHEMLDMLDTVHSKYFHGKIKPGHMAIEMIASMGMAVGQSVFETAVWIGRFIERWRTYGLAYELIYRADEKLHLCGNPRAKDSNIRVAIMDSYSVDENGDRIDPVGNKRNPGPLYGISKDVWSAIAVAKVALETKVEDRSHQRTQL